MWASLIAAAIAAWCHQLTGVILGGELVEGHGVRGGKAMIATLRRRLIAMPARLVSHGGQLIMRLAPGPCLLPQVLAAIRALPAPAGSPASRHHPRPHAATGTPSPGHGPRRPRTCRKAPNPRTRRDTGSSSCPPTARHHLKINYPAVDNVRRSTRGIGSDLIHSGKVRVVGTSAMPASDIIEAQWVAERRGLERFRTDQPPYSILSRGIEREVLPIAQRYGMGIVVWGPLGQGLLTGRVRKGQQTDLRRAHIFRHLNDERRIDTVEQIIPLAERAGLPMTHLALAFAIAHPGVTSAIIGPHTMEQLDGLLAGLLAGADVTLTDEILDQIDEIVPPGTDVGTLDQAYLPPALLNSSLRRRPAGERTAA